MSTVKSGGTVGGMAVGGISHAPWNPRTAEELQPEYPAMVELIESVRALGVVQPIAVWTGDQVADILGDGNRVMCIAGNRRLEAARAVGLKDIPVHVFDRLTEEAARAITRAENECRFGVTPMMDAKLVKSMLDIGRSQAEIAALVGVSEATVCRRAKLLDLDESVIKAVGTFDVDARALEMIAAFPAELQKQASKRISARLDSGGRVSPAVVDSFFSDLTRRIHKGLWIFAGESGRARLDACLACPHLTGSQRDLFDVLDETHGESDSSQGEGRGEMGRCLCAKCYKMREEEAKVEAINAAIYQTSGGQGADRIVRVSACWNKPFVELKAKKRKGKNTCAYAYWSTYEHECEIRWGLMPETYEEVAAAQKTKEKEDRKKREQFEEKSLAAAKIVDRYLFGEGVDNNKRDADVCFEVVKKFPTDFVQRLAAESLALDFDNYDWGDHREAALRLAREVPEIKSLLSAEEFKALENYVEG